MMEADVATLRLHCCECVGVTAEPRHAVSNTVRYLVWYSAVQRFQQVTARRLHHTVAAVRLQSMHGEGHNSCIHQSRLGAFSIGVSQPIQWLPQLCLVNNAAAVCSVNPLEQRGQTARFHKSIPASAHRSTSERIVALRLHAVGQCACPRVQHAHNSTQRLHRDATRP